MSPTQSAGEPQGYSQAKVPTQHSPGLTARSPLKAPLTCAWGRMAVQQPSTHEAQRHDTPGVTNGAAPEPQRVFLPPPEAPAHVPAASSWPQTPAHTSHTDSREALQLSTTLADVDPTSAATRRMLAAVVPAAPLILATESPPLQEAIADQQQQQQSAAAVSPSWQTTVVSPFSAIAAQSACPAVVRNPTPCDPGVVAEVARCSPDI